MKGLLLAELINYCKHTVSIKYTLSFCILIMYNMKIKANVERSFEQNSLFNLFHIAYFRAKEDILLEK